MAAKLAQKRKEKRCRDTVPQADHIMAPVATKPPTDALREIIARIEGRPPVMKGGGDKRPSRKTDKAGSSVSTPVIDTVRVPLGIAPIDAIIDPPSDAGVTSRNVPKGMILNGLHEVRAEAGLAAGASAGFALALGLTLARRQSANTGRRTLQALKLPPIFWIADRYTRNEYGGFYGPGLSTFGLLPEDLIRIHPESREESLWAAGEIAATPGAAAFCLIEIRKHPKEMDLTTTRRLLLRAQVSQTPVIVLRQSGEEEASAALTRWCVHPAISRQQADPLPLPDQFIGPPAFDVSLEKCRGGNANSQTRWTLEWNRDDQRLALASTCPAARSQRPASHEDAGGAEIHRLHGNKPRPGDERQSA